MNGNIFARLTGTKRNLVALLASSAMLTAGCANMATTSSPVEALTTSANLSGKVHGGNQPVSGATVNLYFAAQNIYAAPTLAATTTTSTTDGTGSFSFIQNTTSTDNGSDNTFSCPGPLGLPASSVGDPVVYVVAKGGNTLNNGGTGTNSAAAFIAVYGTCSQLATNNFVDMTEFTTVATMAAVQQFFDPSNDGISADGTGQQKQIINNVVNTIALLANVAKGTSVPSTVIAASTANGVNGVLGVSVTATPEVNKLNTLADAISACVNTVSSPSTPSAPCTTLFSSAVSPSPSVSNKQGGYTFPPATDVVQAIYYILSNPTANVHSIFTLAGGTGAPYQPILATQPSDWTIGISYTSASNCGSGSGGFISKPYDISIDSLDNVWIANSQATKGNLSQLTAAGAAATCVFLGGGSNGGATIDSAGNVWLASTESNNIYRYSTGLGSLTQGFLAFPTPATPLGVTADGLGNVYFTSSANTSLYQIPGAAASPTAVTATQISNVVGANPIRLMPDFNGIGNASDIWVSSGNGYVSAVTPGTAGPNVLHGFSTTTYNIGGSHAYGLAVTNSGDVIVSSGASDNFVVYLSKALSYAASWTSATGFGGINNPTALSIDGLNNIWIPNNTNSSILVGIPPTPVAVGSVSELSAAGNALSPTATGFQKDTSFLSSGRASVVDQAGNVWVIGDGTTNSITEIVGAGVPIYQPYAIGLTNGRFQSIP